MRKNTDDKLTASMNKEMSRRQFLCMSGKGLAALAFAGAALKFGLPLSVRADEEKISVNSLVSGENEMRVLFIERIDDAKSDAFYIMNTTPQGMELFLVDGGKSCGRCTQELKELREDILKRAGLESEINSSRYVLDITLLMSHFHGDHVNEIRSHIAPANNQLRVKAAYYPASTQLPQDGTYDNEKNDDIGRRESVLSALDTFQKGCEKHELPFGEKVELQTMLGSICLYASPADWGTGEYLEFMRTLHFAGNTFKVASGMGTEVLNGNCMWVRAEYAGHSVLFTGDTNKKYAMRKDEAYDLFIEKYGEELRSDIVKFPHHGRGRDAACQRTRDSLLTQNGESACILSGVDGPELAGKKLTKLNVPWYDLNSASVLYTIKESGAEISIVDDKA